MTNFEQTKAAIRALPEGRRTDSQLYSFTGGEVSAQLRIADLKSFVAHLEAERDQYKHLAEGRAKMLLLWELRDGTCDLSNDELVAFGISHREADIARKAALNNSAESAAELEKKVAAIPALLAAAKFDYCESCRCQQLGQLHCTECGTALWPAKESADDAVLQEK